MSGPLHGCRVIELAGLGPAPFAAMTLADMGAEVVRIERPGGSGFFPGLENLDILNRGKKSVALDLKSEHDVEAVLAMVEQADILIEGYRPGVAERLGLGPEVCIARNPRLVYGRMTGWGQEGPLSHSAGHDIGYIALTGALHAIGEVDGPPQIPLNLVGDFGGGANYLTIGVLAALRHADRTGEGQVVDAAIVDGASHLLASTHMMMAADAWRDERGTNMLDGGFPFYAVYGHRTASTWRSARSNHSSSPSWCASLKSTWIRGLSMIAADGPRCDACSRRFSRRVPVMSGLPCSREPTRACLR